MVSVVIPTYNRPDSLRKSLESILNQSILPSEVIVVDDGSEPAVQDSIFSDFPNTVKYVLLRNKVSKGANNARNRGILESKSDYIAFLDDDDQFKKNKIGILRKEIESNPTVDVFYHPAHIHMVNEEVSYITKPYSFSQSDDIFRMMLVQNRIGGTSMVTVRKEALISVGLFDEEMPASQDYELWLRLAKNNYKFYLIKEPLTNYYYITKKSSIFKNIEVNNKAINLIENKYKNFYEKLSKYELKYYENWKRRNITFRHLLNGNLFKAFLFQIKFFLKTGNIKGLLTACVLLFGRKNIFKLRARFG